VSAEQTYIDGAYGYLNEIDWREESPEEIQATATVAIGYALLALVEVLRDRA
jgi:hypothetical protein